jgi:hypothetical protein
VTDDADKNHDLEDLTVVEDTDVVEPVPEGEERDTEAADAPA